MNKPIIKILNLSQSLNEVSGTIYLSDLSSVNKRFFLHRYTKRLILNPNYRKIKEQLLKESQKIQKLDGREFKLTMNIQKISKTTSIDIDNTLKIIIDGLIEPIIGNDNKINEIHITRQIITKIPDFIFDIISDTIKNNKLKKNFGYIISFTLSKKY